MFNVCKLVHPDIVGVKDVKLFESNVKVVKDVKLFKLTSNVLNESTPNDPPPVCEPKSIYVAADGKF